MAQDWFKGLRPAAAQSEGHRIGQTLLEGLNGQQGAIDSIAIHPGHEQLVAPYFFEHAGSRSGSSRHEPAQAGDQDSADDPGSQADEEAGAGGQLKPRCRDDPKDQNDDGDDAVGRPNRLGSVPEEPTGNQALLQSYWANY